MTAMISFFSNPCSVAYGDIFSLAVANSFSSSVCQISNGEVYLEACIFLSLLYKHGGYPFIRDGMQCVSWQLFSWYV